MILLLIFASTMLKKIINMVSLKPQKHMKKLSLLVTAMLMLVAQGASAQDQNLFNHLGVGVSVGALDGIGFEVAVPASNWAALRVGMSFMPKVKYGFDVDIDSNDPALKDKAKMEAKLNKTDFKVLVDVYPIPKSDFRLTLGAYIGSEKLVDVYDKEPFLTNPADYGKVGIKLGDYRVSSDDQGHVQADLKVNGFKPYVGLGYGRAIPKKRLAFNFDLGVQFWGKPTVWTNVKDNFGDSSYQQLNKSDINNDDADKFFDIMEKITVCPVISFRLNGRIF